MLLAATVCCKKWLNLDAGSYLSALEAGTCLRLSQPPAQWGGGEKRGLDTLFSESLCCSLSGVQCQTAETWPMRTSSPENWDRENTCQIAKVQQKHSQLSKLVSNKSKQATKVKHTHRRLFFFNHSFQYTDIFTITWPYRPGYYKNKCSWTLRS